MHEPLAIVAGVGSGLELSIIERFSKSYRVVHIARDFSNHHHLVNHVNAICGQVFCISADLTNAASVKSAFDQIVQSFPGAFIAAAVVFPEERHPDKPFLELTQEEFSVDLRYSKAGFIFAQQVVPLLLEACRRTRRRPTLIFMGATVSLEEPAESPSFLAGKYTLRALAKSLWREFGSRRVHVAHVLVDGVIDDFLNRGKTYGAVANSCWQLHTQHTPVFTFELDLRSPAGDDSLHSG